MHTVSDQKQAVDFICAGRRIWLLASGGKDGVAALGDEVPATSPDAIVVSKHAGHSSSKAELHAVHIA